MTIQQLVEILKARRLAIISVFFTVVLTALVVTLVLPKQYTAEAEIAIDPVKADPISNMPMSGQSIPGYMATQVDILTSHQTALKVVEILKLDSFAEAREQFNDEAKGKGDIRDWLADNLLKNLDVKPSRESNAITLQYTSADPAFASTLANSFVDAYKQVIIDIRASSAQQNSVFFQQQLASLQQKLRQAQKQLADYQQSQGIVATDERMDIETQKLAEISSQLVQAQAQSIDAESRQQQGTEVAPDVLNNPLIQQLKGQLAQQEANFKQLATKSGPNHPEYKQAQAEVTATRAQLANLIGQYTKGLTNTAANAQQRLENLQKALSEQKSRVLELKLQRAQLDILQRGVDNAQKVFDLAMQKLAESAMESSSNATNVAVLKAAPEPIHHSKPKLLINLILACFLGTLLGVGFALWLELMDRRIRSAADIEQLLNVPMLGDLSGENSSKAIFKNRGRHNRVATA
jgi:chain length determinant protein EpsF